MIYNGIKGVIFDLGSTLIEFENRTWDEMTRDGQQLGYRNLLADDHKLPEYDQFARDMEEIKNDFRVVARSSYIEWDIRDAFARYFTQLGLPDPAGQSRHFVELFYTIIRSEVSLCDNALSTLQELKRRGLKTGLMSNTIFPREEHEVDLKMFGLAPYLDFRMYSSDFGKRKPHPDIYQAGLERIGLPAEQVLFVGDRYTEDVWGPQQSGMRAALKFREGREYPEPMPEGFPVMHDIAELLTIIQ